MLVPSLSVEITFKKMYPSSPIPLPPTVDVNTYLESYHEEEFYYNNPYRTQ